MITAPGIGSGLDIKGIVEELMSFERRPLDELLKRSEQLDAQLSAIGQLKSALSSFRDNMKSLNDASDFQIYTAASTSESLFTATADSAAGKALGSYAVTVNNLATMDRYLGSQQSSGTAALGLSGNLEISDGAGGNTQLIPVAVGDSLQVIRDRINDYDFEGSGVPAVKASIIDNRLVLESTEGGADTISVNDDALAGGDLGFGAKDQTGTLASVTINGVTVERSSNRIDDAIAGVTLDLLEQGGSGVLNVAQDKAAITENIQAFADSFNELRTLISDLREGDLSGDGTLGSLERQLLGVINSEGVVGNAFTHLSQIGLSVQKDGQMTLDTVALGKALDSDNVALAELFTKDDVGFANRYTDMVDRMLVFNGLVDARERGILRRQDDLAESQERMERRLESVETRYLQQFNSMDALVGQMNTTSSFLAQQLENLPGAVRKK